MENPVNSTRPETAPPFPFAPADLPAASRSDDCHLIVTIIAAPRQRGEQQGSSDAGLVGYLRTRCRVELPNHSQTPSRTQVSCAAQKLRRGIARSSAASRFASPFFIWLTIAPLSHAPIHSADGGEGDAKEDGAMQTRG